MKKIGMILAVATMLAGCGGELPFARWESLPVGIAATTDQEIETLQIFNQTLGVEVFVVDPDGVKIEYKKLADFDCGLEHAIGCAVFDRDENNFIVSGTITLREVLTLGGRPDYVVESVLAHELGHILGHGGHTETGIMQAVVPTEEDIEGNLLGEFSDWFYSEYTEVEEGATVRIQNKLTEEAQEVSDEVR